jgi:lysophospholipase L1-like esterase
VTPDTPADDGVTLPLTPDAGTAYQDKIIFVGDSLTAHLINRGVLTGGTATEQVWRCENNMMNLNSEVTAAKIIFPGTGEKMTVAEAAARAKPEIMIITLGTDWGVSYLSESEFKACYAGLIQAIQKASPKTKIILQSIFPVTAGCVNLDNTKIDNANKWVKAIAAENGCRYLDTQSILKDDKNCLKENYCNSSDGIHMGKEAYVAILEYIRTHAITD